jgi:hypothetical protein
MFPDECQNPRARPELSAVHGRVDLQACLYAHSDKVSGRCEYAGYDVAVQFQHVIAGVDFIANECRDDLKTFCANVAVGEGRLLECMETNESKLSQRCNQAIDDVAKEVRKYDKAANRSIFLCFVPYNTGLCQAACHA